MNISNRHKYLLGLSAFVLMVSASVSLNGCKSGTSTGSGKSAADTLADIKQLVAKNCGSCHALVPVNALNRDVWQYHTLPAMAKYLGISTYGTGYFKKDGSKGISINDWDKIVRYYQSHAPVTLNAQKRPDTLLSDWAGFTLKLPKGDGGVKTAYTTMVGINPFSHKVYSSDAATQKLFEWGANLNPHVIADVPSPVVNISFEKTANGSYQGVLTCIGQLEPMDFPNGRVVTASFGSRASVIKDVDSDISRPLQATSGDFNKDGLNDYVISASGKLQGHLMWMKQNADHTYTRNVIKAKDGAVQSVVGDYNNDGWPDIMVLFGSGNEGLSLFINDQKGGFKERSLLHFPPVYGSTSFQLADVNHDGKPDLIYTCGYNYRDSRILKPYHGLYIYTNTGNWNFKQSYFYPINGCTKAIAADFDADGDLDIATSAFFADLKNNPSESFIYFEQDKAMHFKPHAIPVSKYGRWFSMDVGDYNGDGSPDIVLGNYSKGMTIETNINSNNNEHIPLIVLENHTKK